MSSPTEQFSNLSLETSMATGVKKFADRKSIIQDILSSFDRKTLPSEYKTDLFLAIDQEHGQRSSEWTIPEDLEGSLSQWASHDDGCLQMLQQLQPESNRSRLFHEKVARRLTAEFERYKDLEEDRTGTSAAISQEVREISTNIWKIVEASRERQEAEMKAVSAGPMIKALVDVCENYLDLSGQSSMQPPGQAKRTTRSSGPQPGASLFHMLIREPEPEQEGFMLELLEWIATNFVEVLQAHRTTLEETATRLSDLDAPADYRRTLQRIIEVVVRNKRESEEGDAPMSPSPPPGAGSGDGAARSGTKRPATDAPGRRRGKKRVGT